MEMTYRVALYCPDRAVVYDGRTPDVADWLANIDHGQVFAPGDVHSDVVGLF